PEDRYASALALRQALADFLRHRHSIGLANAARAQMAGLALLREVGDRRRLHGQLTQCRFGFLHALREWPDNRDAVAGLQECLEGMILNELAHRDLEGARSLLAELPSPRPELE